MTTLTFNNTALNTINHNNQIWLTSNELAKGLGYADSRSVNKIFSRYSDEFTTSMTEVVNLTPSKENKGLTVKTRIFSLRGCHLIAMFARTKVAKDFRVWVLNILDSEVGEPQAINELTPTQTLSLRNAVNGLVTKAGIMYPDAYKLVHQRFNVNHIKQLTPSEIGQAVEYVHSLTLMCSKNAPDDDYHNKMISLGIKKTNDINHAISIAQKELFNLEQCIDSLACSIDVIKTHNASNFSVFESLRRQATSIE